MKAEQATKAEDAEDNFQEAPKKSTRVLIKEEFEFEYLSE